ncbi:glycoside hydrolase [Thraustotheca clavata]|uniref:Glycoside hydrolase n=1 Tax=Thraustotheca clavata TaxID=74557 RepID=A0A1W0A6C4_9STRA|nr:glycoside hydrolase [Thraustotheca clavata]
MASLCQEIAPANFADVTSSYPRLKDALATVEDQPLATWYTDRTAYLDVAMQTMNACAAGNGHAGQLPVFVVYGLPGKDCSGTYSNQGTNTDTTDYTNFIQSLATLVGTQPVLYVLEPDAVGLLADSPTSCAWTNKYLDNMIIAMDLLTATNPNARMYLDVGWWTFKNATTMDAMLPIVDKISKAGKMRGIAINTSNYRSNAELLVYCSNFVAARPGFTCVFDTSRNYHGASPSGEWCNANTAGIGYPPTSNTGSPLVDYYLWLKTPGQSDGLCNSGVSADAMRGPKAGDFFEKGFSMMWDNGYFVDKGLGNKLGEYPLPGQAGSSTSVSPVVWAIIAAVIIAAIAFLGVGIYLKKRSDAKKKKFERHLQVERSNMSAM